jgi:putative ABC transport system permease protein
MALGVALVVAVLVIYGVVYQSFHRGGEGYDLIVGAKGSKEQLVLNTVYYLSQPIENIPYSYYEEFTEGRFAPDVEAAVPVCMGHSYQGFRVVGTVPEMFEKLFYLGGRKYEFAEGGNFQLTNPFDAVVGATAARETNLKVGSPFQAVHGVSEEGGKTHPETFKVVGVLAPTGTPNDRALFVNMEGFYQLHQREHDRGETASEAEPPAGEEAPGAGATAEAHGNHKQITAILVCINPLPPGRTEVVAKLINEGPVAQAAIPARVIAELFEGVIGKIEGILLFMAVLIVVVAGMGIMVSIYNSMSERRHEIAIMRALGASRLTVMVVILLESILLSLGGGFLGLLLGHGLVALLSPIIVEQTGVATGLLLFRTSELILIPGLIVLASVVGYLPAVAAYKTDVARSLTAAP